MPWKSSNCTSESLTSSNSSYVLCFACQDGYDAGYLYECEFRDGDEEAADPEEKPQHEPLRAVPVEKSNDIPISVLKFR